MLSSIERTNEQKLLEARESRSTQLLRVLWRFAKVIVIGHQALTFQQIEDILNLVGTNVAQISDCLNAFFTSEQTEDPSIRAHLIIKRQKQRMGKIVRGTTPDSQAH
eukprot:TRINITY_DN4852_c0_g1_i5.p3 TRINITY_DN4852_c0_g1~~TRINITY_DN4852_c0_g1_i5.p3  ORF type:complete len:107 (+),score=18.63 TRINITY_DN4852_c0_g1_i5:1266-1586(+)